MKRISFHLLPVQTQRPFPCIQMAGMGYHWQKLLDPERKTYSVISCKLNQHYVTKIEKEILIKMQPHSRYKPLLQYTLTVMLGLRGRK